MSAIQAKVEINRQKNLETCLVIATGLLLFWLIYEAKPLIIAAFVIGLIGVFFDTVAGWITWVWYKIAEVMGGIMSKVLLSLVFFGFLAPIAFLYRIFNKDTLQLKKKGNTGSYWTERSHTYQKKDLEQMW